MITKKLKRLVSTELKSRVKFLLSSSEENAFVVSGRDKVVVALAANYGNLGDVAITSAQTKFLQAIMPERDVIDFPIDETFTKMKSLAQIIRPNDIITITGGGNLGDRYQDIEDCRRFVISRFPNNKIVSFPQTIEFSRTSTGAAQFKKSIDVYSRHKDLNLFAREEISFEIMKNSFPKNNVYLVPDIVLSLDERNSDVDRSGVLLCLRDDGESAFQPAARKQLISFLIAAFPDMSIADTHIGSGGLSLPQRNFELEKLWAKFRSAKVVITDRLHGMIFSAITGTPCIALPNNNHKITETYNNWLANFPNIELNKNPDPVGVVRDAARLNQSISGALVVPKDSLDYSALMAAVGVSAIEKF